MGCSAALRSLFLPIRDIMLMQINMAATIVERISSIVNSILLYFVVFDALNALQTLDLAELVHKCV